MSPDAVTPLLPLLLVVTALLVSRTPDLAMKPSLGLLLIWPTLSTVNTEECAIISLVWPTVDPQVASTLPWSTGKLLPKDSDITTRTPLQVLSVSSRPLLLVMLVFPLVVVTSSPLIGAAPDVWEEPVLPKSKLNGDLISVGPTLTSTTHKWKINSITFALFISLKSIYLASFIINIIRVIYH
jgi:hypothetical protein